MKKTATSTTSTTTTAKTVSKVTTPVVTTPAAPTAPVKKIVAKTEPVATKAAPAPKAVAPVALTPAPVPVKAVAPVKPAVVKKTIRFVKPSPTPAPQPAPQKELPLGSVKEPAKGVEPVVAEVKPVKKAAAPKKAVTSRKKTAEEAAKAPLAVEQDLVMLVDPQIPLGMAAPAAIEQPSVVVAPAVVGPAILPVVPHSWTTEIVAKTDVGLGNTLFMRGVGPGLSWEKGVPLTCLGADEWILSLAESTQPITYKFLINDTVWSSGADFTTPPGVRVVITPSF